ncbi:zinc finger and scan domain-containing [Holotrichia oblita]|uniref:Zinc finger and scan domain-containing n=1 Tax=Holotrichia oblita TaxID=644536 RepID=A0ACB9T8F0_HOLOL|nr:zinc finger and scan domain-containing [Holotrichia oblita]
MVNICRLCLTNIPDFPIAVLNDIVSHETKIKFVIPEIDIGITPTLDLCNLCLHLLCAAYTFKLGCIQTEDIIKAYLSQNEKATINLQDVKEFRNCRIRDTNEILPGNDDIKIEIHDNDIMGNNDINVENELNISFICNKCHKTFENEEDLEFHKNECVCYKCSECGEVFFTEDEQDRHFQMHTTTKSYSCEKCYQSFKTQSELKYHIRRHIDKSITCNICLKTYPSFQSLQKHKIVHELLRKRYRCDMCNKSFTTSHLFKIHRNLRHKEQHKCKICNQVFNLYYSLRRHMYNKHYKPFICETCGLRCSAKSVLVEHIRVHTGERPFKCEACGKGFAQKSTLTVHIRCVHETAKPFVCEICGKTFAVNGSLTKHMRVHTNPVEKTIPCSYEGCNKMFNTERAASKHRLRHTADKRHKCTLCDKTFLDTPGLKRHMRTHTVRISCGRFVNNVTQNVCVTYLATRNISGKTMRVKVPAPKPAPWPYKTKRYTMLHRILDKTSARLDENSKLLVVEGPIAAGKSKFAQELADELEMIYFPEANLDMVLTNEYGYDLKQLDPQLPESCRSFDVNNFLMNPKHRLTATFQLQQYAVKYSQYIDALAHILSTGQGVVLDRCVYSDFVFVEAMYSKGYISRADVPVNKCLENIQKRKVSYEKNSPVLTTDYLTTMEKFYKQHYLKDISYSAELLVYDWTHEGEVEVIVEDIERINFNRYDEQDPKFVDWRYSREEMFAFLRNKYADKKNFLMTYLNVPRFDIPELLIEADDAKLALEIYESESKILEDYIYCNDQATFTAVTSCAESFSLKKYDKCLIIRVGKEGQVSVQCGEQRGGSEQPYQGERSVKPDGHRQDKL